MPPSHPPLHQHKLSRFHSLWCRLGLGALTLSVALLLGCAASPVPGDYAAEQPTLQLRDYLNGRLQAHGLFTDRSGRVVKRFTVELLGRWQGSEGVLEEDFYYSDGSTQRRVWRLQDLGAGRYTGQADDVVGTAQGQTRGNAFHWNYTLNLPVDNSVYEVQFDDWMYLMNDKVMLNKASMHKFGIYLGEVTLSFAKR